MMSVFGTETVTKSQPRSEKVYKMGRDQLIRDRRRQVKSWGAGQCWNCQEESRLANGYCTTTHGYDDHGDEDDEDVDGDVAAVVDDDDDDDFD